MCKNCGFVQVTSSITTVKCFKCLKTHVLFSKKQIETNLKVINSFNTAREALIYIKEYKKAKENSKTDLRDKPI